MIAVIDLYLQSTYVMLILINFYVNFVVKWFLRKKINIFCRLLCIDQQNTYTTQTKKVGCSLLLIHNADFALIKHLTKDSGQSLIRHKKSS